MTTIEEKLRFSAGHHLAEHEAIQYVIPGLTRNPEWPTVLRLLWLAGNPYVVIIVTDKRILLCRRRYLRRSRVKNVIRALPRRTMIGHDNGLVFKSTSLGQRIYILQRWSEEVVRADLWAMQLPG
jgi:hypothetical protein